MCRVFTPVFAGRRCERVETDVIEYGNAYRQDNATAGAYRRLEGDRDLFHVACSLGRSIVVERRAARRPRVLDPRRRDRCLRVLGKPPIQTMVVVAG